MFDKLLENDDNEEVDPNEKVAAAVAAAVATPPKSVKKKTVRASLPMFKITAKVNF